MSKKEDTHSQQKRIASPLMVNPNGSGACTQAGATAQSTAQRGIGKAHVDLKTINCNPIEWDIEQGKLRFLGTDAAILWTDPSLCFLFAPLIKEIGIELFRTLIVKSSIQYSGIDCKTILADAQSDFVEGFNTWSHTIATAGWGRVHLMEYAPSKRHAIVHIHNPWELPMQQHLPADERWGCPYLIGRIIGIFNHIFNGNCWASDEYDFFTDGSNQVRLTIYQSEQTIDAVLDQLRADKLSTQHQQLEEEIQQKTIELQTSNHILANIANLDFLTNLNNRRALEEKLLSLICDKSWSEHVLIFIDLDQFKIINDTCGHLAGDRLLTLIGERLINAVDRDEHFVARYGGDEFTIVLSHITIDQAAKIAKKIKNSIRGRSQLL